jgi:branched-chain amino acid transport system ATP-binding protein
MSLLEVERLRGGYGDTVILHDVDLVAEAGELAVIVGPNGAGKSTLVKAVFGLVSVHSGRVRFDGVEMTRARPEELVQRGMAYVPQERNVFPTLTVEENLEMGAFTVSRTLAPLLEAQYTLFPAPSSPSGPPASYFQSPWNTGRRFCMKAVRPST